MRYPALLPAVFVAGFGAGFFLSGRPAEGTLEAVVSAERTSVSAGDAEPAAGLSTEAKAEQLVAAALRQGRKIECDAGLYLAVEAFTAEDFRRLLADEAALKTLGQKLKLMRWETASALPAALIGRWLKLDPAGALAALPQLLAVLPAQQVERGLLLTTVAAKQPGALLALVPAAKDAAARAELIAPALRELARQDPAAARAWLAGCTDAADRRVAEKALRFGAVQADPLRAIELASAVADREEGRQLIQEAASRAAKMGTATLRQLATTATKPWMLDALIYELSRRDPTLAVDLALRSVGEGHPDTGRLKLAFAAFAQRDPAAARARLEGLTGPTLAAAVSATGEEWAAREPAAALAWLAARPEAERKDVHGNSSDTQDTLLAAFYDWSARAPAEARAWADALPPGAQRDGVHAQLARALARRGEPAEATQVLAGLGAAAEGKAVREVAAAWARRDPQTAADWAIAQPAGPAQNNALAGIVRAWAGDNPRAVAEWLAEFPAGEARDRSVTAFLGRDQAWHLTPAVQAAEFEEWFALIDEPWQRAQAARTSYWQRQYHDPAAARAWLSAQPNCDPELIRRTLRHAE